MKNEMATIEETSNSQTVAFSIEDLEEALNHVKPGKASGLDGITTEMIQHFGPTARSWALSLFNNCAESLTIPKIWRQAKERRPDHPGIRHLENQIHLQTQN